MGYKMYIALYPEGDAVRDHNGMPLIGNASIAAEEMCRYYNWNLLELSVEEAQFLQRQAYIAVYHPLDTLDAEVIG